eukprot:1886212-Pleurochrysis_carterae.AAC.1
MGRGTDTLGRSRAQTQIPTYCLTMTPAGLRWRGHPSRRHRTGEKDDLDQKISRCVAQLRFLRTAPSGS